MKTKTFSPFPFRLKMLVSLFSLCLCLCLCLSQTHTLFLSVFLKVNYFCRCVFVFWKYNWRVKIIFGETLAFYLSFNLVVVVFVVELSSSFIIFLFPKIKILQPMLETTVSIFCVFVKNSYPFVLHVVNCDLNFFCVQFFVIVIKTQKIYQKTSDVTISICCWRWLNWRISKNVDIKETKVLIKDFIRMCRKRFLLHIFLVRNPSPIYPFPWKNKYE